MILDTRTLWRRFVIFLLPLMLSNVLQALSSTINTVYIGQLIGVDALAAVSVFFPILFFLMSFVIGLSSGATVLVGQAWGGRNIERVKAVAGTTLTVAFIAGVVVAIVGGLFAAPIMGVFGTPENILQQATAYARVFFIGMPVFFLFLIVTSILRGVGDTVTPLVTLCISIAVGIVVTPALILGWFGLPRIGPAAAAVAAITGWTLVLFFLFFYLRARKHPMAPDSVLLGHLRIDPAVLRMVLRLGLPAGIQMVVTSVSAIVILGLINQFGSDATAAYGAVNQVLSYVQFPAMSVAIAASIFGAQAIGAGHSDELNRIMLTAQSMNLLMTGSLVVLAYLFSGNLVALFITEPAVMEVTQTLLHIVLWSIVPFGAATVLAGIMRSSGTVLMPMLISLGAILGVELPGAVLLSHYLGLSGIWIAYAASFTMMLVAQGLYYRFVWQKKAIRVLV